MFSRSSTTGITDVVNMALPTETSSELLKSMGFLSGPDRTLRFERTLKALQLSTLPCFYCKGSGELQATQWGGPNASAGNSAASGRGGPDPKLTGAAQGRAQQGGLLSRDESKQILRSNSGRRWFVVDEKPYCWLYQDGSMGWKAYDTDMSLLLESAFADGTGGTVRCTAKNVRHTFDLAGMTENVLTLAMGKVRARP